MGATEAPGAELIRDPEALHRLEPEWRELAVGRGSAFVTPEWFWAWLGSYGDDPELRPFVAVVRRDDGTLQGAMPLVTTGPARARTARFAGSSLGDRFHPAAADEDEEPVAAAIGAAIGSLPGRAVALVLENVATDAAWWHTLARSSRLGGRPVTNPTMALPYVRLTGRSWDEYLGSRSRNLRSQLGRKRRALEREHDVAVRWSADPEGVRRDIATLFHLHDLRWHARPGESSLTSDRARAFHADFAVAAAERGWLRLAFLEVDAVPVAAWYGWRLGPRFSYYQAGFDPKWERSNVGTLLLAETIRVAFDEGAEEYDMLLGEEAFKLRFADAVRTVRTVVIAPRLRPLRLLAATEAQVRRITRGIPAAPRRAAKAWARPVLERLPSARRR